MKFVPVALELFRSAGMGGVGGERCSWLTNDQQLRAMLLESRCRVVQSVLFITVWLIMHYS